MAKCATCIFHEKDKRMENAWFLANYNEAKDHAFSMRLSKRMVNARGTIGHVVQYLFPTNDPDQIYISHNFLHM